MVLPVAPIKTPNQQAATGELVWRELD